jgi:DNA end-binding protein Ku
MGIGEIAFSGREHLVAIAAPPDPKQRGLMLYTLRYEEELRDPSSEIGKIKERTVDSEELSLAKRLIDGSTSAFDHAAYRDDYEAAVRKLVDAKRKNKPLPVEEPDQKPGKVINLMDALRQSLAQKKSSSSPSRKRSTRRVKAA